MCMVERRFNTVRDDDNERQRTWKGFVAKYIYGFCTFDARQACNMKTPFHLRWLNMWIQ